MQAPDTRMHPRLALAQYPAVPFSLDSPAVLGAAAAAATAEATGTGVGSHAVGSGSGSPENGDLSYDVTPVHVEVGTDGWCSPRHGKSFHSGHEGSNCFR